MSKFQAGKNPKKYNGKNAQKFQDVAELCDNVDADFQLEMSTISEVNRGKRRGSKTPWSDGDGTASFRVINSWLFPRRISTEY